MRFLKYVRRTLHRTRKRINRVVGPYRFRKGMASSGPKKIVIGSSGWFDFGWIPTEQQFLDLTKPADWQRLFRPDSLDAMLAEHVWEHLTLSDAESAAKTCFTYLKPGGYLRVAVPDGNHPDPTYLEWVRVGGAWSGQVTNDHKVLYDHKTLVQLFENAGFRVELYEYFDEAGTFHYREWDPQQGKIRRSKRFDKLNKNGSLAYTSIIIDAIKPKAGVPYGSPSSLPMSDSQGKIEASR
jgi:predicted SAM-dependent methyltransferase